MVVVTEELARSLVASGVAMGLGPDRMLAPDFVVTLQ
jgi:hypothetical protein